MDHAIDRRDFRKGASAAAAILGTQMKRLTAILILTVTVACGGRQNRESDTSRSDSARVARSDSALGDSASAKPAAQDCVRGEPEPALSASGPAATRPKFVRTAPLEATEDATVDDTTSLRILHGGCAHFVESYVFTVRGTGPDTSDTAYWLRRAASYLRGLPVVEMKQGQIESMAKALETAARSTPPYSYGDPLDAAETVTVTAVVRNDGARARLIEIVYNNAI